MALKNRILLELAAAAAAPPHRIDDTVAGVRAHARDILLYTERFAPVVKRYNKITCNSHARGDRQRREPRAFRPLSNVRVAAAVVSKTFRRPAGRQAAASPLPLTNADDVYGPRVTSTRVYCIVRSRRSNGRPRRPHTSDQVLGGGEGYTYFCRLSTRAVMMERWSTTTVVILCRRAIRRRRRRRL